MQYTYGFRVQVQGMSQGLGYAVYYGFRVQVQGMSQGLGYAVYYGFRIQVQGMSQGLGYAVYYGFRVQVQGMSQGLGYAVYYGFRVQVYCMSQGLRVCSILGYIGYELGPRVCSILWVQGKGLGYELGPRVCSILHGYELGPNSYYGFSKPMSQGLGYAVYYGFRVQVQGMSQGLNPCSILWVQGRPQGTELGPRVCSIPYGFNLQHTAMTLGPNCSTLNLGYPKPTVYCMTLGPRVLSILWV